MASKTFHLRSNPTGGWSTLSFTPNSVAATTGSGWVVGTGSSDTSAYASGVERAEATFIDSSHPDGTLDNTLKDALRTQYTVNGTFDAGSWEVTFAVRSDTNGGSQDGRVRYKLLKGSYEDGSNAVAFSGVEAGSSALNINNDQDYLSSDTESLSAVTFTNEFLFVQLAWERTGAGGDAAADVLLRTGTTDAGTRIVTPNFTQGHGVLAVSGQGSVTHGGSAVPLSGQAITVGQGDFAESVHGGQVFVAQQGSLSPGITMASLTGQAITSAHGTVTPSITGGGNVTVHIDGVEATFVQGVAVIGPTLIAGSGATTAAGSVTTSREAALTGSAISSQSGTVTANQGAEDTYIASAAGSPALDISKALTGTAITGAQGSVSASASDQTAALSSLFMGFFPQSLAGISQSVQLSGTAATFAQSNVGAPGGAALTGSSITVEQGFLGREIGISGQEITSSQGSIIGLPGIVALVGQAITVEQGGLVSSGTDWDRPPEPSTNWTPTSNPSSAWVRKGGVSTSWNRE
jgi:hypothetical protein